EVDSEEEGPCKFSCSGAMATVLYPHFLKRQKKFPGLIVSVEAAPNKLIMDKVISNEIDVGIVTQSTVLSELSYESVGVEALCLVLPKKYSNKKLNFSDLDKIGFINHPDGPSYADRLLSANYGAEFKGVNKLNVRGYINQIGQIMLPVSEGLGFTILPESIVRHFRPQSSIFIAPLKVPVKDELFIVKKKYRSIGRRYEWFEKEIRNRISKK
ncbi:MAG: substrate-binding domain-containing protein, partial [Bacteriovoracaceae bacterium]|nr:substrate-binding domain-containing protein [Bacteriovoracaceae bacterium]